MHRSSEVPSILASDENNHGFYPPKTGCRQKKQGTKALHCFTAISEDSTVAIGNITYVARGAETDAESSADGILPFVSVWDGGLLEVSEECSLETRRDSFQERQTPDDPCGRDWRRNAVQQRMLQITAFILLKCDCECQQFFIYN